jgi:hypothetical protein
MKCVGKTAFWWRWDPIETWRNLIITYQFISISNFRENKSGIVNTVRSDGMEFHKSVFGDRTHFKMASDKGLTKNVILWSYSNLSFCSGRQIVDTVYSRKQVSSYQIWNYTFIHFYIYETWKFCLRNAGREFFVLSENVHFSQQRQESGVITRQSPSRCEWGEKMAVCRTLGRKLFDHILMRKLLEAGKFFCLCFLLWFLCRFFILHSSPLQLCLHIILTSSSLSLSWALPLFISLWFW